MDNALALGLLVLLLLRGLPLLLMLVPAAPARRLRARLERYRALLDIAGGTLMAILVGALIWQRAWLPAAILGTISLPSWSGLWAGLQTLARSSSR